MKILKSILITAAIFVGYLSLASLILFDHSSGIDNVFAVAIIICNALFFLTLLIILIKKRSARSAAAFLTGLALLVLWGNISKQYLVWMWEFSNWAMGGIY